MATTSFRGRNVSICDCRRMRMAPWPAKQPGNAVPLTSPSGFRQSELQMSVQASATIYMTVWPCVFRFIHFSYTYSSLFLVSLLLLRPSHGLYLCLHLLLLDNHYPIVTPPAYCSHHNTGLNTIAFLCQIVPFLDFS